MLLSHGSLSNEHIKRSGGEKKSSDPKNITSVPRRVLTPKKGEKIIKQIYGTPLWLVLDYFIIFT